MMAARQQPKMRKKTSILLLLLSFVHEQSILFIAVSGLAGE